MEPKKSKSKSRPIAGSKKAVARSSVHLTRNSKKSKPKAQGKTVRNPPSFDLATLSTKQQKLHDEITAAWSDVCTQNASIGRKLVAMHETFTESGEVKRGGPGSQWTRYLAKVGIPKSTAQDYMNLAKKRDQAGISENAEQHLASVGVCLDKPKVVDALLTPDLRKKIAAVKCIKDATALKPLIMEAARTLPRTSRKDGGAADVLSQQARLREASLTALLAYIQTQPIERRLEELSEICSEALSYRVHVTIPIAASDTALPEVEAN